MAIVSLSAVSTFKRWISNVLMSIIAQRLQINDLWAAVYCNLLLWILLSESKWDHQSCWNWVFFSNIYAVLFPVVACMNSDAIPKIAMSVFLCNMTGSCCTTPCQYICISLIYKAIVFVVLQGSDLYCFTVCKLFVGFLSLHCLCFLWNNIVW